MKQIVFSKNEEDDFINEIKKHEKVVLFVGYGSKKLYKKSKLNKLNKKLDKLILEINNKYKNWIAVFGGDNYNEEKPDIAYIMKYLNEKGIKIAAIQSDHVKNEWNTYVDKHIELVYYKETTYKYIYNDNGEIVKNNIVWGGEYNGKLAGPSEIYLGRFIKENILNIVVAVGGGLIGLYEVNYAFEKNIDIIYVKSEMENVENENEYGPVDEWVKNKDNIIIIEDEDNIN